MQAKIGGTNRQMRSDRVYRREGTNRVSPYGYFKGTWEYLMTILGGLKYLNEEISFRKNNLHHLTPHVRISHIPHIRSRDLNMWYMTNSDMGS